MQRTEPPPACSMRATGATTTRSTQDASASNWARGEPGAGLGRHHEDTRAVGGAQLEHVARKCFERIEADIDDAAPACRQPAQGRFAVDPRRTDSEQITANRSPIASSTLVW